MKGNGEVPRIGVYVCDCGTNIAGKVRVAEVVEFARDLPGVVVAREYKYMCSDPGQDLIKRDIQEYNLNRIVVASCSPLLHEHTFRKATAEGGLNPYLVHHVNIREDVSWVHEDSDEATRKAKAIVHGAVLRVAWQKPLEPQSVPVRDSALVVGGGIAGISAALTLAEAGKQVYLVEREPTIGGHMAKFDKTFPTLDCAACILTPKMTAVKDHPNITLITYAEVEEVDGYVGNFKVKVRKKPRYVHEDRCVGCLECIEACVFKEPRFPNEFDLGLSKRKPVYIPFPQAVPPVVTIDPDTCLYLRFGKCKKTCVEACGDRNAIDFDMKPETLELEVGTIILATGFKTFDPTRTPKYGYGRFPEVYTSLEIERLVNSSGPTGGEVVMRNGQKPKRVGIIHCVGSRDKNTNPWCSKVCCMYSLKLAHLIHERSGAEVYNFYIDMRTPGKGYEEFYNRLAKEGVHLIRGRVAEVTDAPLHPEEEGKLIIRVEDTNIGVVRRIPVDMVVLAVGLEPQPDADEVRRLFNISCSTEGWFLERHPKLAPVETFTDGVFVAGACQGPKDIPETVAQAQAAAANALALMDKGSVEMEPNVARVNEELCSGCHICIGLCPYGAISFNEEKKVAEVNEVLCKGCGTCTAACPSGALSQNLFSDHEVFSEIMGVLL